MSNWTYVNGVIEVDTYARSTPEALYKVQTAINHLPRITGSEGDVEFYVNIKHGYCMSSNADEFGQFSNLYNNREWNSFETQSRIVITISDELRDRYFDETLKETTLMLSRLGRRLQILNCILAVKGFDIRQKKMKSFVFHDPAWLLDMPITDWTDNLLWKKS